MTRGAKTFLVDLIIGAFSAGLILYMLWRVLEAVF